MLCLHRKSYSGIPYHTTLHHEHDYNRLQGSSMARIHFLNEGNLHIPSLLVVAIIHNAEHVFVLYVSLETYDQINTSEKLSTRMILEVSRFFLEWRRPTFYLFTTLQQQSVKCHLKITGYVWLSYLPALT